MHLKLNARFTGHKGSIYSVESGPGDTFFTGGSEGIIVQWNASDPESGELLARVPGVVYCMYLMNDSLLLAGTAHGMVHVIDLAERREVRLLQYHAAPVFRLGFWKQQQLFFSLSGNGVVQVYDNLLNPVYAFSPSQGKLRSIAFAADYFVIGTSEGKILRYSNEFELLNEYQAHQENFGVNALWLNDKLLVSGSRDAHLVVSDPVNGNIVRAIPAHNYAIYRIASMPDNSGVFATASRDKTVKLWSSENFELLQRLDTVDGGHVNSVNDLAWLKNGWLVSVSDDRSAIAWEEQG